MYIPPAFREDRPDRLQELMREYPLATLVSVGANGLIASHIPLVYGALPEERAGVLHGHLARANAQWKDLGGDIEALAIFQGPHGYISPSWYPTKERTGRVVPTWNYTAVHAYGTVEVYTEAARLRKHLESLTAQHEAGFSPAWTPNDAPAEFIDGQLKAIVGIDIRITRLEGKWKMSQNRLAEDRRGVIEGLSARGDDTSKAIADLVGELSPLD